MTDKIKILIVEHDPHDLELMQYQLRKGGIIYESLIVQNEPEFYNALQSFIPDIILSDYSLPSFDGPAAFKISKELTPGIPFIFVSGNIGEENSIEFIKNGLTDYVLKDKLFTLATKVKRALQEAKEKQQKDKTARELVQSERRLARAQQIAHLGSWELDFVTNEMLLSDEAGKIFGISPNETRLSFQEWLSLVHPEDIDFVLKKIKESKDAFKDTSYYHRIARRDGSIRHVYSDSKTEEKHATRSATLYGIIWDVTEIKMAEAERSKMLSDLTQRNKDLEQFAYIVSHNLRASVANIIGATAVLNDTGVIAEKKMMLTKGLNESVTKLDNVIKDLNQILQVKRTVDEVKETVRFSRLVNDIIMSMGDLIANNEVTINCDFFEIDELLTLKSYLHSIFFNLISNSIKYRQPTLPCIITIKSRLEKNKLQLIFTDNGMGIDLKKKGDQVFGLYKKFHTNIEGKGMGLFMVKTQVETLGGKISINSEINKGIAFNIEFEI